MTSSKALIKAVTEANDYAAVRKLAAHWHGGHHQEITALSHGMEWHHVAIQNELEECLGYAQGTAKEKREADAEVTALLEFVKAHYPHVYDSTHGHQFSDSDDTGTCLTCGGTWDHVHTSKDDPSRGRYRASNGDDASECTGDTSMVHGDPREQEHGLECENGCPSCQHECNCLFDR